MIEPFDPTRHYKWGEHSSALLCNEAQQMEIEQYDRSRHVDAPADTLVRVNSNNSEDWDKLGWYRHRRLPNGQWIMRRDFPHGLLEGMPTLLERLIAEMPIFKDTRL
jgi:hypothetical protein